MYCNFAPVWLYFSVLHIKLVAIMRNHNAHPAMPQGLADDHQGGPVKHLPGHVLPANNLLLATQGMNRPGVEGVHPGGV